MKIINNIKKNTVFLLAITVVILFILLKDDYKEILNALSGMKVIYIVIAIFFFFVSIFF